MDIRYLHFLRRQLISQLIAMYKELSAELNIVINTSTFEPELASFSELEEQLKILHSTVHNEIELQVLANGSANNIVAAQVAKDLLLIFNAHGIVDKLNIKDISSMDNKTALKLLHRAKIVSIRIVNACMNFESIVDLEHFANSNIPDLEAVASILSSNLDCDVLMQGEQLYGRDGKVKIDVTVSLNTDATLIYSFMYYVVPNDAGGDTIFVITDNVKYLGNTVYLGRSNHGLQ